MAFAGMDVGTSGCKILVYDLDGTVLFQTERRYGELGEGGRRELNPKEVTRHILDALRETGQCLGEQIEAMAVTSLGESVVCLGDKDEVLANSLLTGDSRGISETEELIEKLGAQKIFEVTGLPPNELYGLPKYMWLNRHTDAIKKAKAIFYYEDLVGYLLTGERKVSYSSAARSMAFDIRRHAWSKELLSLAGIAPEKMSLPVESGTVIGTILPEMAERLCLNPDMKVAAGGHDQSLAALGSGLKDMETAECGMGTCEFMFTMLPGPLMSPYMLEHDFTCIPYIIPGTYLSSIEITTCGALKNWARDTLFADISRDCQKRKENFWAYMDKRAEHVKTDVLVLPQFGSSGNPSLAMDARGTISGLTIHTKPEELYRAVLEGMAFQSYLAYEKLEALGTKMNAIAACGGGAASELTLQLRADIFNRRVFSLESCEAGALGCMMLAALAVGAYPSLKDAMKKTVKVKKEYFPNEGMHRYYMEKYRRYEALYRKMHDFL